MFIDEVTTSLPYRMSKLSGDVDEGILESARYVIVEGDSMYFVASVFRLIRNRDPDQVSVPF